MKSDFNEIAPELTRTRRRPASACVHLLIFDLDRLARSIDRSGGLSPVWLSPAA